MTFDEVREKSKPHYEQIRFDVRDPQTARISVAIPVFNEEAIVSELVRRVLAALDALPGGPHQLVIVDDGSSDGTLSRLSEARAADPRIEVTSLSRNFGHQIALSAALDQANGDAIILMDGDLQDRPEVISLFVERWLRGADVVYAVRTQRKEGWLLRTSYHLFYRLIESIANLKLPRDSGDFSLISREVADVLRSSREHFRYVRGLRTWAGFRQEALLVERDSRFAGDSKYTWKNLFQLAFDGIFSFSIVPVRLATYMGVAVIMLSSLLGLFWLVAWFYGASPQGFTTVAVSIAFFSGVQLMFLGVIGEYIGRIYEEVKNRPLYVTRRIETLPTRKEIAGAPLMAREVLTGEAPVPHAVISGNTGNNEFSTAPTNRLSNPPVDSDELNGNVGAQVT